MNSLCILWLVVAVLCLMFEMGNPGLFYFLSFCFGALGAGLASMVSDSIVTQVITFLIVTILGLGILKYWVRKKMHTIAHNHTNMDALVGKQGLVIQTITQDDPGRVKIGGEVWLARSYNNQMIVEDQHVIILRVSGAHVVVKKNSEHKQESL